MYQRPLNRRQMIITTVLNYLASDIINDTQIDATIHTLVATPDKELTLKLLESNDLKEKSQALYIPEENPSKVENFFIFTNYPEENYSPNN